MIKCEEYVVETYLYDEKISCYRLERIVCNYKDLEHAKLACTTLKCSKDMIHSPKFVIYKREIIRDDLKEEFNGYVD